MPPSRRQKRAVLKKRAVKGPFIKILALILIILLGFFYIELNTKYWNGEDKLGIAIQNSTGEVLVTLLDPELSEETIFLIPGNTEVDVAKNLGTITIGNVQKLGINEGIGGVLLPKTITKSFLFPVYLWSDREPNDFKFVTSKNSNIPLGDRIAILLFAKRVRLDRSKIDLGKSQFLIKTKLSDGTAGYKITESIFQRLTFYFSENEFSEEEGTRVYIKDATEAFDLAQKVGEIVEVMGAKVVAIEKIQKEDIECVIGGKDKEAVVKISRLFNCEIDKNTNFEFDVEIKLGSKFFL